MNLGLPQLPEWVIGAFLAFAVIGVMATLTLVLRFIVYIAQHLHWL